MSEQDIPPDLQGHWTWQGGCLRRTAWPMIIASYHPDPYAVARECDGHMRRLIEGRAERLLLRQQRKARRPPQQPQAATEPVQQEMEL